MVNAGAVLGQMAMGGGASRLQQVMGSVGVASVSKQTFTSTERFITEEAASVSEAQWTPVLYSQIKQD